MRFQERHAQAQEAVAVLEHPEDEEPYVAPPRMLREYLEGELHREYEFKCFVLGEAEFEEELEPNDGYEPQELLLDQARTGKEIINSLIKLSFLYAHRHLSDSQGGSRADELSRQLGRYYQRKLEHHGDDYNAIRALAASEILLNQHLERVFADTLQRLTVCFDAA